MVYLRIYQQTKIVGKGLRVVRGERSKNLSNSTYISMKWKKKRSKKDSTSRTLVFL